MSPRNLQNSYQSGFVALLSTIIIGAVLLVMTIEAGQAGFYTRFMVLGTEAKEQSRILATACGNQALAKILADLSWTGSATTTNEIGSCYIYPIQKDFPSKGLVTILVQAKVRSSVTNYKFVYSLTDIHIGNTPLPSNVLSKQVLAPQLVSWSEVAVMP